MRSRFILLPSILLLVLAACTLLCRFKPRSQHAESNVPLHQMTASAIGNTPEGNINDLKATIMRTAMSGDERLFEFKVTIPTLVGSFRGQVGLQECFFRKGAWTIQPP